MMMALAGSRDLPAVLVPGGVTLLPHDGEDAGRVQSIGVRFVHREITMQEAADAGCRACASPGGGCVHATRAQPTRPPIRARR